MLVVLQKQTTQKQESRSFGSFDFFVTIQCLKSRTTVWFVYFTIKSICNTLVWSYRILDLLWFFFVGSNLWTVQGPIGSCDVTAIDNPCRWLRTRKRKRLIIVEITSHGVRTEISNGHRANFFSNQKFWCMMSNTYVH